jgi:hypothetical protein
MIWFFGCTTMCAVVLAVLKFMDVPSFMLVTLLIPALVYFFVPWIMHGENAKDDGAVDLPATESSAERPEG